MSLILVGDMWVFVSRRKEIVTVPWKNGDLPKLVVDSVWERDSEKSWKLLKISSKKVTTTTATPGNRRGFLRVKPKN